MPPSFTLAYDEGTVSNNSPSSSNAPIIYVNGKRYVVPTLTPNVTLLSFLREHCRLTGSKLGCGEGGCGACTVMLSNVDVVTGKVRHRSVNACLMLACAAHGCHVTTVEGIGNTKDPHPIQTLMVDLHGSQCGFCTPGIVMSLFSSSALAHCNNNDAEDVVVKHDIEVDGNLCRCTGYRPIWDVIHCLNDNDDGADDYSKCSPSDCAKCTSQHCRDEKKCNEIHSSDCNGVGTCGFDSGNVQSSSSDKVASIFESKEGSVTKAELVKRTQKLLDNISHILCTDAKSTNALKFESNSQAYGKLRWVQPTSMNELIELKAMDKTSMIISGNTELGVDVKFKNKGGAPHFKTYIYPNLVPDLLEIKDDPSHLEVGANVDLTTLADHCVAQQKNDFSMYSAIAQMLQYFASTQIRNVASLAGNICTASPISDMNPVLMCLNASIIVDRLDSNTASTSKRVIPLRQLFLSYRKTQLFKDEVIRSVSIPKYATNKSNGSQVIEFVIPFKQARRREDDISIVSAGMRMVLEGQSELNNYLIVCADFAFGGMAPTTKLAVETSKRIVGSVFDFENTFLLAKEAMLAEFNLPDDVPGGQAQYRKSLALGFLYKFLMRVHGELSDNRSLIDEASSYMTKPKPRPTGSQYFPKPKLVPGLEENSPMDLGSRNVNKVMGSPQTHASALQHCTGEAEYADDISPPSNLLHGALILSTSAKCKIASIEIKKAIEIDGVVDIITYKEYKRALPSGKNEWGPIMKDEEIFSSGYIGHYGTVIGVSLGETFDAAQAGAAAVEVTYEDDGVELIMSIQDAINNSSFYESTRHIIENGNVDAAFDENGPYRKGLVKVEGEFYVGGQEHFYLETNSTLCIPKEGNTSMSIFSSTQAVNKTQMNCAAAIGLPANRVEVKMKRMGGGFGGKETRTVPTACVAAIASRISNRPVKVTLDRNVDMSITGQRHAFYAKYSASAFISDDGKMKLGGFVANVYSNAGSALDLSGPVMDRALFHIDGPYKWQAMKVEGVCCKTFQPPHTAFRGFGGPQGMAICEHVVDHLSMKLRLKGSDIDKFRFENLYQEGDSTHFGQEITKGTWNVPRAFETALNHLDYSVSAQRKEIESFNSSNKFKKRGLCVLPTKFGIAFTAKFMNQGGALVHLYTDGTVLVSHGGTEMGQGLHTKVSQVAACAFGIPLSAVFVNDTASDKIANSIPTAASMSTDLYGMATLDACSQILTRLRPIRDKLGESATLAEVATSAFFERIDLSAHGFFKVSDDRCGYDWEGVKPVDYVGPDNRWRGLPFNYFTQGCAVSEVEVDVLTGDHRILRSNLIADVGSSINPAIDVGQIEGAFTQGVGWCTMEEIIWGDDDHKWIRPRGRLLTQGPGSYKIPAFNDVPEKLNVVLLDGVSNPFAVHSSKAVGEPPFFLGCSVFFAIKDAVRAARASCSNGMISGSEEFSLMLPATSERIRMSICDELRNESVLGQNEDPKNCILLEFQPKGSF